MPKLTAAQLREFALSQVPLSGEIVYADLYEKIRASSNPEAVAMLPQLKQDGTLVAKLVVDDKGNVRHTYSRRTA